MLYVSGQQHEKRLRLLSHIAPKSRLNAAGHCAAILCLASAIPSSFAQVQVQHRIQGPHDQDFPTPTESHKPNGYRDASAVEEIKAYETAIGASTWSGLEATGTLTFDDDQIPLPITLSMLPGNRVRLDVTTSSGHEITILNGALGIIEHADGRKTSIFARSAAVGLVPFELPIAAVLPTANDSLIDDRVLSSQGRSFHRVSIEIPIPSAQLLPGDGSSHAVLDAYFDPGTHLLAKTATLISIPGSSRLQLRRVTTYSNYQPFGQLHIPSRIAETINGQAIWTLDLSSVDTQHTPTSNSFIF